MSDTDKPKRRGRPATGTAMSSTERSKRLHERAARAFERAFHPGRPLQDVSDSALLLAFANEYRRKGGEILLIRYARELLLRAGTPPSALASLEAHYSISVESTDTDTVESTITADVTDSVETTDIELVESTDYQPQQIAVDSTEIPTPFTLAPATNDSDTINARIRQMKDQGMTSGEIAALFDGESIPTLSGRGSWTPGTIRNLPGWKTAP